LSGFRVNGPIPQRPTSSLLAAVNTKDESFFKELGARLAQARKKRGLTQVQLATTLGIAQQTLAHYEGGRLRLPASLLPVLAQALKVAVEELLGPSRPARAVAGKRGPAAQITQLPRAKQRFVIEMLDTVLAQASR
jgi:transcriptional regulator with XRE-family HTH domain